MHKDVINKNLTFLGLIRRAGMLEIGDEAVSASARRGTAKLIISSADASDGSKRRAKGYAETYNVRYILSAWTKEEIGNVLGRNNIAMIAVTDRGMSDSLVTKMASDKVTAASNLEEIL